MMSASDIIHQSKAGFNLQRGYATGSSSSSFSSSGSIIRPSQVTEKSFIESVAGFINEVQSTPIGFSGEQKIHITWARFEVADINDIKLYSDGAEINGNSPPLLLILGYTSGVQIWLIPITGEAQEVLSWKQGVVKTLRLLPTPERCFGCPDNFAHCRPLIVTADSTSPGATFTSASFISLKSGETVHNIKFNSEITDIVVNRRVIVTTFKEKLAVFDSNTLEPRFNITSCYPSPGVVPNPVTLGDRWLAYADQKLISIHRSFGGLETDTSTSMAAWSINMGSKLAQGVSKIYSNFFSSSSAPSSLPGRVNNPSGSPVQQSPSSIGMSPQKGVVTILDTLKVYKAEREEVNIADKIDGVVAHFIAHNKAIVALQFDSSGSLLLTCDSLGNYFNVFRIVPHPAGSCYSAVHHIYALYRGDTPGTVQDLAFSPDSRWVTVSTLRGTTHIFPITPYGGPVGVRTHTSSRVVNRLSRFHRSAGIDETKASSTSSGRNSPNPNLAGTSPSAITFNKMFSLDSPSSGMGGSSGVPPVVLAYPNPHMPPYPNPTIVQPVAQLRQPYLYSITNQTIGSATTAVGRKKSVSGTSPSSEEVPIRLAATFAPSRAWLVGNQPNVFNRAHRRPHDSLYIMANHGVLLEYTLDVQPDSSLSKDKICESSPIELMVTAYGQWNLSHPKDRADLTQPLPIDNPLMLPLSSTLERSLGYSNQVSRKLSSDDSEEKWLSQVEILTHSGPHRRLWMGPQFCFKTLQPKGNGDGNRIVDLDISLPTRPEQSNPVNMPPTMEARGNDRHGKMPVFIEAGSASSFELSPHFSNAFASSRNQYSSGNKRETYDVEKELEEAMAETLLGEENLLDGVGSNRNIQKSYSRKNHDSSEEEFFCLTPDDSRSLKSRSRNASATSQSSINQVQKIPYQVSTPDTKIFSVAVEARKADQCRNDLMKVCDMEPNIPGQFAIVSSQTKSEMEKQKPKNKEIKEELTKTSHSTKPSSVQSKDCDKSISNTTQKKSKSKRKKKESKSSVSSSNDESTLNEVFQEMKLVSPIKSAKSREVTPQTEEMAVELDKKPKNSTQKAKKGINNDDELISPNEVAKETVDTLEDKEDLQSDDNFMEITNNKVDSDDEKFEIQEKQDSDVEEVDDTTSNENKETTAGWIDTMIKPEKSDAILKGIEQASKLWDEPLNDNSNNFLSTNQDSVVGGESSEDDLFFKPVYSGKKTNGWRRRKQNISESSSSTKEETFNDDFNNDSESSANHDSDAVGELDKPEKEGWSFEVDDQDVDKLIDEVYNQECQVDKEEKTPLEDVFKFDSELSVAEMSSEFPPLYQKKSSKSQVQKTQSMDDINNVVSESGEDSSNEANNTSNDESGAEISKKMATSLNVSFDETNRIPPSVAKEKLSANVQSASESSVGNSPSVKKSNQKKKKKKKRF